LLYLGVDDYLDVGIVVLSSICIYYSLAIARTTEGAPQGWYVIIVAFTVRLVYRVTQLYFEVQSTSSLVEDEEAAISFLATLLFVVGLWMLYSRFRKRRKALGMAS